jgi:hypothetical protein
MKCLSNSRFTPPLQLSANIRAILDDAVPRAVALSASSLWRSNLDLVGTDGKTHRTRLFREHELTGCAKNRHTINATLVRLAIEGCQQHAHGIGRRMPHQQLIGDGDYFDGFVLDRIWTSRGATDRNVVHALIPDDLLSRWRTMTKNIGRLNLRGKAHVCYDGQDGIADHERNTARHGYFACLTSCRGPTSPP